MAKLAVTLMFAVTLVSVRVGRQHAVAPAHEVVAGVGTAVTCRAILAVVDRLRGRPGDRTVRARRVGQGVGRLEKTSKPHLHTRAGSPRWR